MENVGSECALDLITKYSVGSTAKRWCSASSTNGSHATRAPDIDDNEIVRREIYLNAAHVVNVQTFVLKLYIARACIPERKRPAKTLAGVQRQPVTQ